MNQKRIGQYIQQLRKANKMTQKELADRIGVSDKTVSKWENGNSMPDISLFSELCCVLNTNINELLSGEPLSLVKKYCYVDEWVSDEVEIFTNTIFCGILETKCIVFVHLVSFLR
ncbi:MAG: helix-turn-helix transcriptional regulator [Lachnospiraceae bacterium]|nr:helix-turn-helix transcriptional regulator [Lachnospiraceae bacterium]